MGDAFADHTAHSLHGPLRIADIEHGALVVPEIELGKVPLQILRADMMVHAVDAAIQDREIALDGVRVRVAPNIFLNASC